MGIQLTWDNEQHTILVQTYEDPWTLEDYQRCAEETGQTITGQQHTVHVIIDNSRSKETPSNILSVVRYADSIVAPNQGIVVIVRPNSTFRAVSNVSRKIAPRATRNTYFAASLEDARHLIAEKNERLTPSPSNWL
jgi:hypothetical protein